MGGFCRGTVLAPSSQPPRHWIGLGSSFEKSETNEIESLMACVRTFKAAVFRSVDHVVNQPFMGFVYREKGLFCGERS